MINKRTIEYDVISGILILGMLYSHASIIPGVRDTLVWNIFYHTLIVCIIPWFFFKSGMFFSSGKNLKELTRGGVKRLLIPFVVFCVLGQIFYSTSLFVKSDFTVKSHLIIPAYCLIKRGYPTGNLPLWFLLTLFVVRILYRWLYEKRINSYIISVCCLCGAFLLNYYNFHTPYYLSNIMLALMYYSLGYKLKDIQYKNIVCLVAILLFIIIGLTKFSFIDTYSNNLETGNYFLAVIVSLSSIIIINNIFRRFNPSVVLKVAALFMVVLYMYMLWFAIKNGEMRPGVIICYVISAILLLLFINSCWSLVAKLIYPVSKIGKDSMCFFISHWPLFWVGDIIVTLLNVSDNWLIFDVRLILFILLLPLFRYILTETRLSWMVGNK